MTTMWLPESAQKENAVRLANSQFYAVYRDKLKSCPPDKYIVALADDVVLAAEEWIDLVDYIKVVCPTLPKGEVHLLQKVDGL